MSDQSALGKERGRAAPSGPGGPGGRERGAARGWWELGEGTATDAVPGRCGQGAPSAGDSGCEEATELPYLSCRTHTIWAEGQLGFSFPGVTVKTSRTLARDHMRGGRAESKGTCMDPTTVRM